MKPYFTVTTAISAVALLLTHTALLPAAAQTGITDQQTLCRFYDQWKGRYVTQDTYVTDETQYYVYYNEEHYSGDNTSVAVTVSEAHGYGMLITACMAEYDPEAKDIFDDMVRYYLAHPSDIGPHLMSWQQCDNGTALIDGAQEGGMTGGETDSATDGDLDIAYALLLADSIWGSSGELDYATMAKNLIGDIMEYEVNHTTWTLNLGDWAYWEEPGSPYYGATRSSDFIMSYFPIFAAYTEDDRWMQVYDSTYAIIDQMVEDYGTGLLPDFLIPAEDGSYTPAPADFLEDVTDGQYAYNSCRTPWRIGVDALLHQNASALGMIDALNAFLRTETGGDPEQICAGYTLDGEAAADYEDLCFTAPFLIAADCGDDEAWEAGLREYICSYGMDVYYGDTIKMLVLLVDAGAWLEPDAAMETGGIRGDVNENGEIGLTDVVLLLRYLLGEETLTDSQWKLGDMQGDGRVNGADLALLRQEAAGSLTPQ